MAAAQSQEYVTELFDKAQSEMKTLADIDAQIGELLRQRRGVQAELLQAQTKINEEFGRLMRESDELPAKVLAEICGSSGRDSESPAPPAEAPARTRFAHAAKQQQ
jgi:hypothetical protein